jgi:hypothetical protein
MAIERRVVLRWTAAVALAPVLTCRAGAVGVTAGKAIAPPSGPMTFVRRLERQLPDGNKLVVARSFRLKFTPSASNWIVAGEQAGVTVDAPARIAALAALERQRVETGLFPFMLDRSGLIVGGPETRPAKELDEAVAIVRRELDKNALAAGEREELDAFIRAVHDAEIKLTAQFPGDLFAPREQTRHTERELALPGGGEGTIAVSFSAASDPATGLMREARREIVTAIGEDRRLTREDWSLAPV